MKKFLKTTVVVAGLAIALVGSISQAFATEDLKLEAPAGEGCVGAGSCGTTPGGMKVNGSYRVW